MATKTYVLLEHLKPSAPIYQRISEGQRMKLDKIPVYGIPRRVSFTDQDGNYRTHRYKANAMYVSQEEQVEKQKIEANAKFTTAERRDMEFRNNTLTTNKVAAQRYLESLPYMEGVEGTIDNVRTPIYKVLDTALEKKVKNDRFRLVLKVGNMIDKLSLKEAQELLIRLNGSYFQVPTDIEACVDLLTQYVDEADEDALNNMLKKDITVDEKAVIMVGKAINKGILHFDMVNGQISKKKNGKMSVVRTMQAETPQEQERLFIEFLTTEAGSALYSDIEKDVEKIDK